jgi:hypothetical protein
MSTGLQDWEFGLLEIFNVVKLQETELFFFLNINWKVVKLFVEI